MFSLLCMAYSWERWYDGACAHNIMKGQGAGKYVRYMTLYRGSTISVSFSHILYYHFFFTGAKVAFFIRSTLWNRRPLKWNSTIPPLDFLPLLVWVIKWWRVNSGNDFTYILLNFLWFPEHLGKINYLNFTKTKKYFLKWWVYYLITFLYHRWQITLAYSGVYL